MNASKYAAASDSGYFLELNSRYFTLALAPQLANGRVTSVDHFDTLSKWLKQRSYAASGSIIVITLFIITGPKPKQRN